MVFPLTPLDFKVELDLVGDWSSPTDITSKVYGRDVATIKRGRSSENQRVDPSSFTATLNNRDGRFSQRNPLGPYFGLLSRNTRIRASILAGTVRAYQFDGGGSYFVNDNVGVSITGDIDIRIDVKRAWRSNGNQQLSIKYADPNQRSWFFESLDTGHLRFWWSADGTNLLNATSTVEVPYPVYGRKAVRVTLDVNNGAGGNTVTFYYSDTISGSWTQLGSSVTQVGVTSIFDSTSGVTAAVNDGLYAYKLLSGIAGVEKANPDFTAQAEGTTTFSDAAGNSWQANNAKLSITARRYRFFGEVSSWPQSWDSTGTDVYVPISAAGILRRLGQGATELRDPVYRLALLNDAVDYWPLSDPDGSVNAVSANGGKNLAFHSFNITGVTVGRPIYGQDALFPFLPTGMTTAKAPTGTLSGGDLIGHTQGSSDSSHYAFDVLYRATLGDNDTDQPMNTEFFLYNSNGIRWHWRPTTNFTQIEVAAYTNGGTFINGSTFAIGNLADGSTHHVRLDIQDAGGTSANWVWYLDGVSKGSGTINTGVSNIAHPQDAEIDYFSDSAAIPKQINPVVLGQFVIWNGTVPAIADSYSANIGYDGELAGTRVARLCTEEDIPIRIVGCDLDTPAMGPQSLSTVLTLLQECQDADQGLLYEPRENHGLIYRTRVGLDNQASQLTLDYDGKNLSNLEPVDDDTFVRNDITVSRNDGSSVRETLDTGTLSTAQPPAGVGRYTDQVTVNLNDSERLNDHAGWRLHLGTVDEARYPTIGIDLARAPFTTSASLRTAALDTDINDVISVIDLPTFLNYDDVQQLVFSLAENFSNYMHTIQFGGQPASPWNQIGIYSDPSNAYRYDSDVSTLSAGVNSSATSLSVATVAGNPLWTTTDVPFDIIVSGERMTVTAVAGASSPQTFTVTRSVNGVVKAQSINAKVSLFSPTYYTL